MVNETASLARLSMSLPAELLRQLDMMVDERGLPSRSQLIAELIRHALAEHEAHTRPDEMLAGTITIVYRGDASGTGVNNQLQLIPLIRSAAGAAAAVGLPAALAAGQGGALDWACVGETHAAALNMADAALVPVLAQGVRQDLLPAQCR